MKTPPRPTIQLSSFRPRQSRGRGKTVNFYEGFWKELALKAYWWVVYLPPRVWAWAKQRDHTITIKIRWVVAGLLVLALWPRPGHIVYGDPIAPAPHVVVPKPQVPLPATPLAHVEPLAPAPVPVPVPVPVAAPTPAPTGGCQSYFSGDYYLDNIIRFESGGNSCATNYLGCFGLLQACPGAPLRSACGGNPGCQITWFQTYKTGGRSWAQVWQHELDFGWW